MLYSSLMLGESQAFIISLVYIYMDDANMNPAMDNGAEGAEAPATEETPAEAPAVEGEAPAMEETPAAE